MGGEAQSVKQTGENLIGKGKAGPGRPKGLPNKTTAIAKEIIAAAAARLGGVDRLVAWAEEDDKNESAFWTTIFPKLLPLQLTGADGGAIQIQKIERTFVSAPANNDNRQAA